MGTMGCGMLSHVALVEVSLAVFFRVLLVGCLQWAACVKSKMFGWLNHFTSDGKIVSKGGCIGKQDTTRIPRQLLQVVGQYLDTEDVVAARQVCKEWHTLLSAGVQSIQLPPHLWQWSVSGQHVQLYRLLDVFRHLQQVRLDLDVTKPCDSWSIGRAMSTFRAHMPTLRGMQLACIMDPQHWRALLCNMQCLSPQLTTLNLQDICWPPVNTLHLLTQFTGLQQLHIRSPHFSRLEKPHLQAIGNLTQLRDLLLCFRTVDGTANLPLSLDPLSSLVRLRRLRVHYTGLSELASAVVFCSPSALAALQQLTTLSVQLVPLPSLAALNELPQLHSLALQQAQPISSTQTCSLSRCQQLRSISLSSIQWSDIPQLSPLTGLRSLDLQLWQPARGSLPGETVGRQLVHLRRLGQLRSLKLKGQCELSADMLGQLAACWPGLTVLDLCCLLPDGSLGLQQFTTLRSLKLQPYKWDVWSSDPPVLLYPSLLPLTLTALEGIDVWCMDEPPPPSKNPAGFAGGSSSGSSMRRSNSYCGFTGIWTSMSSVGSNLCSLAATGGSSSSSSMAGPGGGGGASGSSAWSDNSRVDLDVKLHGLECIADTASTATLCRAAIALTSSQCLLMNTPQLQRLVLRSTSPFERKLHMPDLSNCSQLEYLELHHSQLNQCHLQHIAASCPNTLRSLKLVATDDGARIRASGLTILTRLSILTNLSVHAHERAINRNVRKAISTMSQLRSLTLLTSPDYPTAFARSLACLTQLTNLVVLRVGLGFGALDALRRLGTHVSRALPHCTYEMLTDCTD